MHKQKDDLEKVIEEKNREIKVLIDFKDRFINEKKEIISERDQLKENEKKNQRIKWSNRG